MAVPTLTANSPSPGYITWGAFNIRYGDTSYSVGSASTASKFVWWKYNGGSPILDAGDEIPQTLTIDDMVLFGNKNGTPINLQTAGLVDGGLIVSGSIFANALAADSVTAEKILAGEIDATHIAAGSIDTNHIAAGAVEADQIAANSITADKIVANEITSREISSEYVYANEIVADQISGGNLDAVIALIGTIKVGGAITINQDGIKITQDDDTETFLSARGTGNTFQGQATLDATTLLGNLTILGLINNLNGSLTLGTGVSDPTQKPGVTTSYDSVPFLNFDGNPESDIYRRGLGWDGTRFLVATSAPFFYGVSKYDYTGQWDWFSGGAQGGLPFRPVGGVVKVGTSTYVLGQDDERGANWYVYIYNSSWVKTGEWTPVAAANESLAIGVDGTTLLIAKRTGANNLYVDLYTTAGASAGAGIGPYAWGYGPAITAVHRRAVDTATVRYVVASTSEIRVFNTSTGARVPAEEWPPAALPLRGLGHDGTNWYSHDGTRFYKYTELQGTYDFGFTWVDDNTSAPNFGAETAISDVRTLAPTKRAKWTVSLPAPPPDDGTIDGANTANLYAAPTGNTLILQAELPEGTNKAVFTTLATSGDAPPVSNQFALRAGALGRILSQKTHTGSPTIDLKGDGAGRVGPLEWDANSRSTWVPLILTGGSHTTPSGAAAWRYPTGLAETTFVAPLSGRARITAQAYVKSNADGTLLLFCPEVRLGGTIRSGTVVMTANVADSFGSANVQLVRGPAIMYVYGLTPGATYNAYFGVYSAAAGGLINNTQMLVEAIL